MQKTETARPPAKQLLPFRSFRDQYTNDVILECNAKLEDGQLVPYRIILGPDPMAPHVQLYNTVGRAIFDLMNLYYALESRVGGLIADRDEAQARVAELEGIVRDRGRPKGSGSR